MNAPTKKFWNSHKLKRWFAQADKITYNCAQSDQDIFVLSVLDGKENGTYLEIGAGWPLHVSNTALLELDFGWNGVSIDYVDEYEQMWKEAGRKTLVKGNGQTIDFSKVLTNFPKVIDYLSLDCDPGTITFEILQRLPWQEFKFRIITFEHEAHSEGPAIKLASRKFLTQMGYQLVVSNISDQGIACDYEDWWVHPELVDSKKIQSHLCTDDSIKYYRKYLYQE